MHFPRFVECDLPEWMRVVYEWTVDKTIDPHVLYNLIHWLEKQDIIICKYIIELTI